MIWIQHKIHLGMFRHESWKLKITHRANLETFKLETKNTNSAAKTLTLSGQVCFLQYQGCPWMVDPCKWKAYVD
jgi:hypothetical protein